MENCMVESEDKNEFFFFVMKIAGPLGLHYNHYVSLSIHPPIRYQLV